MMAQNTSTIDLIEVGEQTKTKFVEQAQKWNPQQLIDAIEICNHADINYKNSKNPRLTVEIALMQLASLTANSDVAKKKKFIILAPFLSEKQEVKIPVKPTETQEQKPKQEQPSESPELPVVTESKKPQNLYPEPEFLQVSASILF
jgi:DNA polymerase-3 subunit gamma/tau